MDNLWITIFSNSGAVGGQGNRVPVGRYNNDMNSDTYTDQIRANADLVAGVMELMKTSIFAPAEMHEWVRTVKMACDSMVSARIQQWHHRGY